MGSVLHTPAHKAHKGTTGGMTVDMDVKRLRLMRDRMIDDVGLINDLLETKQSSYAGDIPSYKIGERGQLIMVYRGTELELFKGGKGDEEFDWFVYQVLDVYGEQFVEDIRGKDLYRIKDLNSLYLQCCEDVVACAVELNIHFQAQTGDHCKWFLYEASLQTTWGSHSWLIHEKACELILAKDNLFTASGDFQGSICELDPLWKEEQGYYDE